MYKISENLADEDNQTIIYKFARDKPKKLETFNRKETYMLKASGSLSRHFIQFAEECRETSPLYESLSMEIAYDKELLAICTKARKGQPVPNLLFGAVHFLLHKGKDHQLKAYYPSITTNSKPYKEAFPAFKDFCLNYQNEIIALLQSKLVQTNEVRRCAYLYPVFCMIYEKVQKPLALIEIGTSAGLQLLWDHYSYSYGQNIVYGNKNSKLHITTENLGENSPIYHEISPPVATRIGFDLNIIDLNNEDEKLWMKSLIWPEHDERLRMFENATNYLKHTPIQRYEGDGVRMLPEVVNEIPKDQAICIFHTHVANQMPEEVKNQLLRTVTAIGKERQVFHIYNNLQDKYLHLDYYLGQVEYNSTIAEVDGHGKWFKWLVGNKI